jgi:DNA primase large subunit
MHYPWLPLLKDYYKNIAEKSPFDFVSDIVSIDLKDEIFDRTLEIFTAAFDNLENVSYYKIDSSNVYLYILLKIMLYLLDNKRITNRIANLYSKINYYDLINENDYNTYQICNQLELDIKYTEKKNQYGLKIRGITKGKLETNFRIHFLDYLKLENNLRDDYRKLVNIPIKNGYIYIQKRNLMRLIQEYVRNKVLEIENDDKSSSENLKDKLIEIREFKELYDKIETAWKQRKEEIQYFEDSGFIEGEDINRIYPSCMKEILMKAGEGQNLIHIERLVILFFLLSLNYPVEEIIQIFSYLPDFDREKTSYQINFAKNKEYVPHACETLKSLDLCMAKKYNDTICIKGYYIKKRDEYKKINHPLSYVRRRRFIEKVKADFQNNQIENKDEGN